MRLDFRITIIVSIILFISSVLIKQSELPYFLAYPAARYNNVKKLVIIPIVSLMLYSSDCSFNGGSLNKLYTWEPYANGSK